MIRRIEPGGLESWRLAVRMVIFMDFYRIEGSVVLGFVFYGFHRFYVILSGFVWISLIPGRSGVPGLIFYGFHRFYIISNSFVRFHGIQGPEVGRPVATCGTGLDVVARKEFAILVSPRGLDDSMIRC